jgi:hypothetical protein
MEGTELATAAPAGLPISKEQWFAIESELSHPYGIVRLDCDGYQVSLQVEMAKKLRYQISVYVNGFIRGAWLEADSEEGRRFLPTTEHFVHPAAHRAEMIKIYGGKRCKKADLERINRKFSMRRFSWTSVTLLRRHYLKNNKRVSLVGIGFSAVDIE